MSLFGYDFPTPKSAWSLRKPAWIDSANALIEKCKAAVLKHERGFLHVDIDEGTPQEAVDHAITVIEGSEWKASFCRNRNANYVRSNGDGSYSAVEIVPSISIHAAKPCHECTQTGKHWLSGKPCHSCKGTRTV